MGTSRFRGWGLVLMASACAGSLLASPQKATSAPHSPQANTQRTVDLKPTTGGVAIDASTLARLPATLRTDLSRSTVPLLAPREPAYASRARLLIGPTFSVLASTHADHSLTLQSSRLAYARGLPSSPAPGNVRGQPGRIFQDEGGWTATWHELGVAWSAHLTCAEPNLGACRDATALEALLADLQLVSRGRP